jgi:hypothetical protein
MPAVTLAFFAAGGAALAAPPADEQPPRLGLLPRVPILVALVALLAVPALIMASERSARAAKQALERGDCATATRKAQSAADILSVRSEPHEVLGYCALRDGRAGEGLAAMRTAVERDPHNWRVHYGLSLALAVSERDPRPAIKVARRLNPLESLAYDVSDSFSKTTDPQSWRRRALSARHPKNRPGGRPGLGLVALLARPAPQHEAAHQEGDAEKHDREGREAGERQLAALLLHGLRGGLRRRSRSGFLLGLGRSRLGLLDLADLTEDVGLARRRGRRRDRRSRRGGAVLLLAGAVRAADALGERRAGTDGEQNADDDGEDGGCEARSHLVFPPG